MIMGIAFEIVITPEPTIPTTIEVVVEEDCTMLVARMPIKRPMNGFDVALIRFSANSLPKPLNAVPIKPMLTRNK